MTLFPYKMFLFQKTELFPNLNPGGCCTLSLIWKSWHLNIFGRDCKGETVEFVTFLSSLHASKCFFPCVCVWLSAVSWTCVTNCISSFWRLYGEQDISYPNSHDDQEKGLQKWEESPIECKLRRATELGRIFTASSAALTSWAGCWDRDYLKTPRRNSRIYPFVQVVPYCIVLRYKQYWIPWYRISSCSLCTVYWPEGYWLQGKWFRRFVGTIVNVVLMSTILG